MELLGNETYIVPLYYHIFDNFHIQFGREEFCFVVGLRIRVKYWTEYDNDDELIPFRRRVFSSSLDGQHITDKTLVLLGVDDRRSVTDWMLRNANVKRWSSLYATQPTNEVDKKTYSIFGFTWAFKTWILQSFRVTATTYYNRHSRYPRVAAWSKKKEGNVHAERLTPDETDARSNWWVSSRAYFDGGIGQAERIPRHLNRQNLYEVPSEFYRQFKKQKRDFEEQKRVVEQIRKKDAEREEMYEHVRNLMEELKECLRKMDFENEHLKSKVVDFTTVQNLQVQVKELQSENEHLKSKVVDFQACQNLQVQVEELKSVNCEKIRLLEEQSKSFYEVHSEFESETVLDTQDNSEKDLILNLQTQVKESELLEKVEQMKSKVLELVDKLQISDQEMKQQIILFEKGKRMFLAKNEFLEKVSSLVQKEYNDLLASNDVLKQRLETKFKVLKHDHSLEKMFEMIEQEYESNVSKIFITSSTIETKNLEFVKEIGDKVRRFDDEKKVFENKILKLEKDLTQRVKDFDDVKTELSRRTDKFEMYFANFEKKCFTKVAIGISKLYFVAK
nr:hypothetical protein [Tanacetum cinerariifolium]